MATQFATMHGTGFEVVRYSDGSGRVYHVRSESVVVENAHLIPDAVTLHRLIVSWVRDPQRRTIVYRGDV